jgi:spermidine synthase
VVPWVQLDAVSVPGGADLRLMQRGAEFSIMLGTNELMNSRVHGSERALARLACERVRGRDNPAILIGGLGMGFTLRAALEELPDHASVMVAELMPSVIAWSRGPMAAIFGTSLGDPRVSVRQGDVAHLIASAQRARGYDAILLDVDNGPDGLVQGGNDGLYSSGGLRAARAALRPAGVLAVWSAHPDARFAARFARAGFAVEEHRVRANGNRGARHVIWLGTRDQA